ncbi:PREDICTED: peroxisomal targeting signal 1 receptor [Rhagoletis zephyria]|uniref:peroxisomal targeting signal 1 receptor n=1 Tax=Rhagoletis zephyria TaxID=28612 RepID=UPI0008113201|nr:PREDICTED: peroxisomal targeting signal 1 receptor [Rhagoletis zephyria]XP_017465574.1 PREDICTED: peroxisomal targeting signal 1 receptor [Rhagoletis zephyria]
MSLRQLVEGDCGGVNPLMQLGAQFTRDAGRKDEGFTNAQFERSMRPDEQMVSEFLGQVAAPPQSFQMNALLEEMREIEQANTMGVQHRQPEPSLIDDVTRDQWFKEFNMQQQKSLPAPASQMVHMQPQQQQLVLVREFFDEDAPGTSASLIGHLPRAPSMSLQPLPPPHLAICPPYQPSTEKFFEEANEGSENVLPQTQTNEYIENWIKDYQESARERQQSTSSYNEAFWQRLQDEWQKLSEGSEHPWLSEYSENYDPYKEYEFTEENPMSMLENALEKGKEYMQRGDIPSAVLCFEAAAKKEPENAEAWELLGLAQAENEMDPQSIAALKRSLELRPDNNRVLMALSVCYTNESLQSQALRMLVNWMQVNPKYKHLLQQHPELQTDGGGVASSLVTGSKLEAVQNLFLDAVRLNPQEVDADVQEALGVLYNLSSEYDKAVDCFRAALHVDPQNAKVWNRLGASLANGSRSVEAVEAYQRALQLEPGFIRVRYNVGVCCMNLKAYKQAVEHLLTALNMQANSSAATRDLPADAGAIGGGQAQMSESIWSTLKMVISLMGRSELHDAVNERNLKVLNEAFMDAA